MTVDGASTPTVYRSQELIRKTLAANAGVDVAKVAGRTGPPGGGARADQEDMGGWVPQVAHSMPQSARAASAPQVPGAAVPAAARPSPSPLLPGLTTLPLDRPGAVLRPHPAPRPPHRRGDADADDAGGRWEGAAVDGPEARAAPHAGRQGGGACRVGAPEVAAAPLS
jgi:hypothetical protein